MRLGDGFRPPQKRSILFLVVCGGLSVGAFLVALAAVRPSASAAPGLGQASAANYDESKAGNIPLPDPLVFNNGKRVRTPAQWKKRREEILKLYQQDVYGVTPKRHGRVHYQVFDDSRDALGGKAIRKQVTIYFPTPKAEAHEDLLMYLPANAPRPVPVILAINFGGNQTVDADPGIKLAIVWTGKPPTRRKAPESSRGHDKGFDVEKILARGYGFATICYQDIEPDFQDGYSQGGLREMFMPPHQPEPTGDYWGAIGAWAYGMSRAMDYLQKDKDVDAHRVAIMGHSRLGKTALWAGAQDKRFAMVLANCSGRGGASPWRRNYGETLASMSKAFPYWFCPNLMNYVGEAGKLPVDSDELIALIAPRPVYITGAQDDQWADPHGMFLAAVAAGPVYKLLGAEGLETDQMPGINQPIAHTIGFHVRDGKHAVTAYDWDQYLAFADAHLKAR